MPSDPHAARQGATIAFHEYAPKAPASHAQSQRLSAAAAAALASTANRRPQQEIDSPPGPEVGSVRDKIERFTANSLSPNPSSGRTLNNGRERAVSASAPPSAQQIAARMAADRPLERKEVTASTIASIGANRSVSRAQSRPPGEGERRELHSPAPIRPVYGRKSPLDSMLRGDQPRSEQDPAISGRPPSLRPRTADGRSHDLAPSPFSSRQSSVLSEEPKPRPPARPTDVPPHRGSLRKQSLPGTPLRTSTPSLASISGQSLNTSSSSIVDASGGMSEEALSNAIVASALASARASPVPKVGPPPPPQQRRTRSILHLGHTPKSDESRTPSPPRGMLHTLRGIPKADDDAEAYRRHRMHLVHKHPHKHHEGDRKRWRREVSEKERKRYEGVWASNKGLLISPAGMGIRSHPPSAEDMVLNLVVREIWSRSLLPAAVLEQVWDLVDRQNIGLLTREEFVVGMWLIDQQLKGHKLPVNVPDTVWDSVQHVRLPSGKGRSSNA